MYGVGCQIRGQAGHGAAHSLATYLEAAELIPRLADLFLNGNDPANLNDPADLNCHFNGDTQTHRHTDTHTDSGG